MASAFNLTAQINLRGPSNTRAIASQMRKQLSDINVKVNMDLKGSEAKNVAKVNQQLKLLSQYAKMANKDIDKLSQNLNSLGSALGTMGTQGSGASQSLQKVKTSTQTTTKSLSEATTQITEFGKQSGLAIRRFAAFSAVTGVVYSLTNAINAAFKEFVQFDREVVRLSQVTGNSIASLGGITNEITRLSTSLGVASKDLISVSVTLAQAGLSAEETKTALEALAKSALAPSFNNLNDTVEGSIALMRQFGISAEDLEESLGSINAVAASFAVEASDIIKAIQRTGGVFASASQGVSQGKDALNEFIAIFTSVRSTTREGAETIATGLRTIFTRIQRGSTIESLKELGISLTDAEGKFVGTYEAIRRLSEGLSGLDPRDLRFGQIVEELGGFRQIGKVIPLIQQFATAQEALAVAQSGQGSLSKNAAEAQKSLAVQFEKTRESFVALVRDIGNSATFQGIAKVALTTANAFITLASALKPLLPLLTALTAIKGASILSEFGSGFLGGLGKKGGGGAGGPLGFATGGRVPGQGNRDTVAAMLTPGEYVIRKKAVEKIGVENLERLNRGGRIKGYTGGGPVRAGIEEVKKITNVVDGDTFDAEVVPTQESFIARFRPKGYDAYETSGISRVDPKRLAKLQTLNQQNKQISEALKDPTISGTDPGIEIPAETLIEQNRTAAQAAASGKAQYTAYLKQNRDKLASQILREDGGFGRYLIDHGSLPIGPRNVTGRFQEKNLGGFIQKFAGGGGVKQGEQSGGVGIFDSDMIGAGSKDVLNAILSSGKAYDVISGPAGSGKTTFATQRFGKNFVLSADDLDKFKEFIVLSSAGETKSGDFSPQAQGIMSGARQITALRIPAEKITQQRQQRLDNALRSGSQDKRSTKQLQGTINAPTSIPQNLYDQFSNVEFLEQFASGGLVQRFDDGGDVGGIKVAKTGKINKSDIERLTEKQAAALLENPNVQKNLFTVSQLQKRIQQRQAVAQEEQELVGAKQYGLVGLYGSPRNVTAKTEDGDTVQLIGKTLDKKLSDEYEKMMTDGFEQTVAAVGNNMASRVGASAASLDKNQMEKAGLYNAIGAYLEAAIATLGAPYDKDETNDPIDFAGGIGSAAALFGIPSDIPTDTTRTVFGKGKSPNDFLGQVNRYRKQIQRFANGGSPQDTVPALLTPGEFVINKEAAKKLGSQKLNQLNKADRIQGFNKGGAVGFVQSFADGGGVRGVIKDRQEYLARIVDKLGISLEDYEKSVRASIIRRAETLSSDKKQAQIDLTDLIVKKTGSIDDEGVIDEVKEKATEYIATMMDGIENVDSEALENGLSEIIDGMKQGLSVSEIKEMSEGLKEVLEQEITARGELVNAQEQTAKELGFLTSRMKVRDLDVRAQKSLESGKFGSMDKMDLRKAQQNLESSIGQVFDGLGERFATSNIPGMKALEKTYPKLAKNLTAMGDKFGGVTGILGAGSSLLASKLPELAKTFDHFAGTVSDTSDTFSGIVGGLEKGGSLALSGAVVGQQLYGRRGAAVGGLVGGISGSASGFIKASVAKETENALKGVTAATTEYNQILDQLNNARTVQEREMLEKQAIEGYNNLSKSLENSAKVIEDNRVWNAFSAGLDSLTNSIMIVSSTAAAMSIGGIGFGGGGGRRRSRSRKSKAYGGRIGLVDGGNNNMVPVHLAPGEGVLSPEVASKFTDVELQRLNNADKGAFGANAGMLDGSAVGVVPGNGTGKVDNFKTNLAAGSYVIKRSSMEALYAANGGRIGANVVTNRGVGFASGGSVQRQGAYVGALIRVIPALVRGIPALVRGIPALVRGGLTLKNAWGWLQGAMTVGFGVSAAADAYGAFTDDTVQNQQLAAQMQMVEQLKSLSNATSAQSIKNARYSERIIKASDPVEARDAKGDFIMSEAQREKAYSRFNNADGTMNVLNRLAETQARSVLSNIGMEVPSSASVQEFLDALKTEDIDAYNAAISEINKGNQQLRKNIYLQIRQREGAKLSVAEKEFEKGVDAQGKPIDERINKELSRINRGDILAQRMQIINRSISKFTLNLTDIMNRLSASMNRTTVEAGELFERLDQYTAGLIGPTATAGRARTSQADVLKNIQGYSADELDAVVSGINTSLGNTKETQEMSDFVRGLQVMRNELPMILRAAGGQDLDVNQTQSVDKMLKKMFAGISIGENVEKQLRTQILDVITSQTGSRSPLTFNELAEQVPALKELNATAEKAREVFLQYAEAQIEMNNRLAHASDRLASMLLKAAQLGIKADEIRLESALDLKRTFGETASLEELQAPFQAQINGLVATAGGRPNMTPMEIGEAIASKQAELTAMSATPEQQTENLANGNIARLTKEINAYQTALDKLANSTSMADAAMKKIAEQERISEGRRQGVMGLLGMINDPERLFKFTREQQSFGNVMSGDASLNDIARGIESLSLVEATNTPEDFQRILQQFVRNALNIAANAAGPQGAVITQLLQTVEKDFAVGAEERGKLNPELQAAIDSYTIAIETQVQAVETQQKLITQAASVQSDTIRQSAIEFKQQILTAARTAAQELEAAADRIGLKDTQDIEAGAQVDAKAAEEIAKAAEISANAFTEHAKTVKEAERTWYEFLTGWTGGATVATATLEATLIKPLEMMGRDVTRIRQEMNQTVVKGRITIPSKPTNIGGGGGGAGGWAKGGVVYASKGRLINFQPKGTDTVPAMLTPGEFVVRRSAAQNNLGLLKAINSGANVTSDASTGTSYANRGGIISAKGYSFGGGVLNGVVSTLVGSGSDSLANVFNTFVKNFRSETNNFSDLINSLARVFPALNGPVNIFGTHIDKFNRTVSDLKKVEIKAPNIPEVIKFQGGTVRVELIAPADDFKLNAEDERRITKNLEERLVQLIGLGR